MEVIIFTNEKGGCSVCYPTGELPIELVQRRHVPLGTLSFIVDNDSLPNNDADFFDAWEQDSGNVTVNLQKAKNITKDRLRREREPLLAAQDVAFQRALETGSSTAEIVAEKQRLRDITNLADACTTTAQLRALKAAQ